MMNRPDFSEYVAHFTKDAEPLGKERHPDDDAIKAIRGDAYERLVGILKSGTIRATFMPWTNKKAVAFTECPFWSLVDHAQRYSPYAIGFTKARLFAAGGGPAFYVRPDLYEKQRFHEHVHAFVTPFMPPYAPSSVRQKAKTGVVDYTHEREWRVPHDFTFKPDQVQFVIVDTYEDMAKFPKALKDDIGRDRFVIMSVYRQIEHLWPTHRIPPETIRSKGKKA